MRTMTLLWLIPVSLELFSARPAYSKNRKDDSTSAVSGAPKVYIDCGSCDLDYIRTSIGWVNYVRDPEEAEVDVLVTTQGTGSGGTEYTLTFIGMKRFTGMDDTLMYVSRQFDSSDKIREGIVRELKLGLVRYAARTPVGDEVVISYRSNQKRATVKDKWDYWVFSVSGNSFLSGQQAMSSAFLAGSVTAKRITNDWKISLAANLSYDKNTFDIDTTTVVSISRSRSISGYIVKSLSSHWSIGGFFSASASTYNNEAFNPTVAPAIEYDLFPYSQSTRRQLRFLYHVGYNYFRYYEATIYGKSSQSLLNENLSVSLDLIQPWGSISTTVQGSNYFYDFRKNNVQLYSQLSLKLFEGVSLNLFGSVSMIHDQLSLPAEGATPDEILLQQKQLATQYSYFGSIGLSYTFGSIFNNIVNPRFGTDQSGTTIIISN